MKENYKNMKFVDYTKRKKMKKRYLVYFAFVIIIALAIIAPMTEAVLATITTVNITKINIQSPGGWKSGLCTYNNSGVSCYNGTASLDCCDPSVISYEISQNSSNYGVVNAASYFGACEYLLWVNKTGQVKSVAQWKLDGVSLFGVGPDVCLGTGDTVTFLVNSTSTLSLEIPINYYTICSTNCLSEGQSLTWKTSSRNALNTTISPYIHTMNNVTKAYNFTWTISP